MKRVPIGRGRDLADELSQRKPRETSERERKRIVAASLNRRRRNYMRNSFPMETGFYGLVRNTGCLDKSNLSCSICICIRRQRAPSLTSGTSRAQSSAFWNSRVCEYSSPLRISASLYFTAFPRHPSASTLFRRGTTLPPPRTYYLNFLWSFLSLNSNVIRGEPNPVISIICVICQIHVLMMKVILNKWKDWRVFLY